MNPIEPIPPGNFTGRREMSAEEQAAYLSLRKSQFDPLEAEQDYQQMMEGGIISWEQLMQELDEIDKQAAEAEPRSP